VGTTSLGTVVISLVQGIGEILPISSAANMIIAQKFLNLPFFGFSFKIALHVGSLFAILLYFKSEIADVVAAIFSKKKSIGATYFWQLVTGTIPVVILGYLARDYVKEFDSNKVMGISCIFFGVLLYVIDRISISPKKSEVSPMKALIIGIFQALSIFPGVSRLGICITSGRMLALGRKKAIFFALFLAVPSILGSLCLEIYKTQAPQEIFTGNNLYGMIVTAIISMIAIIPCIKFMERRGFLELSIYRCCIGALLCFL
jgi:undecaprenyl-diphosphatase